MTSRLARIRSMLFIPANKPQLAPKAVACGADAIIWDLEDAVPEAEKSRAREQLREHLETSADLPLKQFVRINGLDGVGALHDLAAITCPALAGVLVPKVTRPSDVTVVATLLSWFEAEAGLENGSVCVVPVLESASGMRLAYEISSASPRVAYVGGLGVAGGDVERALGFRWSREGTDTLMMRSKILLDARSAGTHNPITGMWTDIGDLSGLREFARESRDLGYEGMLAIHPSHVPVINEEFGYGEHEMRRDIRLVEAMRVASAEGDGSTTFEGRMIDHAMSFAAAERLRAWGKAEEA